MIPLRAVTPTPDAFFAELAALCDKHDVEMCPGSSFWWRHSRRFEVVDSAPASVRAVLQNSGVLPALQIADTTIFSAEAETRRHNEAKRRIHSSKLPVLGFHTNGHTSIIL